MPKRYGRAFKVTLLFALALVAGSVVYLQLRAARLVSGALTDALGQPASVSMVSFWPSDGLALYNLNVTNPPGFTSPVLLNIRCLSIKPDYKELRRGRLVLDSVGVYMPSAYLEQDRAGRWNFAPVLEYMGRKKPRPFTLHALNVTGGRLVLPARKLELGLPVVSVKGLSSLAPKPASFTMTVNDNRGSELGGEGVASIYGGPVWLNSTFRVRAGPLDRYIKMPKGLDLGGSGIGMTARVDYVKGVLRANLDGGVTGLKSSYYKGKGAFGVTMKGDLVYDTSADSMRVSGLYLSVPGLGDVRMKGAVKRLKEDAAFDFNVSPTPVELAGAAPYLPRSVRVSGRLLPGAFIVKGAVRPLKISAEGKVMLEGVSASYNGRGLTGINGEARLRSAQDGALNAGFKLSAAGGNIDGRMAYAGSKADCNISASGINLSRLSGMPKGTEGVVRADIDGEFDSHGGHATGRLSARGVTAGGRKFDSIDASYAYGGDTLSLKGVAFKGEGISASLSDIALIFAEGVVRADLKGGAAKYGKDVSLDGMSAKAVAALPKDGAPKGASGSISIDSVRAYDFALSGLAATWSYDGGKLGLEGAVSLVGNPAQFRGGVTVTDAQGLKSPFFSGKIDVADLTTLNKYIEAHKLPVSVSGGASGVSVSLSGESIDNLQGTGVVRFDGLGLDRGGRPLLRGLSGEFRPSYTAGTLSIPPSAVRFGSSFALDVSGHAVREAKSWNVSVDAGLPDTPLSSLQEGVLEALPASLKWAEVGGTAGLKLTAALSTGSEGGGEGRLTGEFRLKDATLGLADIGVNIGPVSGSVPLGLSLGAKPRPRPDPFRGESFDRESYGPLHEKYSAGPVRPDLVIKKASYGFVELDDIELHLKPGDGYYEAPWFGLSAFGGRGFGYLTVDFTGKDPRIGLSLMLDGFSLKALCSRVPAINGYLSGRVDGVARVLVTGAGYGDISGAAMFWARDSRDEGREISKEFIKKLMGSSLKKYMFIGDRKYDTGEVDVILSGGDLVFDNLLIAHTNFLGTRDLNISVAPVSNKVSIEYLLDVIREVGERAGSK